MAAIDWGYKEVPITLLIEMDKLLCLAMDACDAVKIHAHQNGAQEMAHLKTHIDILLGEWGSD